MKKICAGLAILVMLAGFAACKNDPQTVSSGSNETTIGNKQYTLCDFCTVTEHDDFTRSYEIVDKNGNVLFSYAHYGRCAEVRKIDTSVLEFVTQAGTGMATRWAVYCDVKNSRVSETFDYVLMAQGDYVVCGNYTKGEHSVTVQNIFDKSAYFEKYVLPDCPAAEIFLKAEPKGDGTAVVTYLVGDTYEELEEVELTIALP